MANGRMGTGAVVGITVGVVAVVGVIGVVLWRTFGSSDGGDGGGDGGGGGGGSGIFSDVWEWVVAGEDDTGAWSHTKSWLSGIYDDLTKD